VFPYRFLKGALTFPRMGAYNFTVAVKKLILYVIVLNVVLVHLIRLNVVFLRVFMPNVVASISPERFSIQ